MPKPLPPALDRQLRQTCSDLGRTAVADSNEQRQLLAVMRERIEQHGDTARWYRALEALPVLPVCEPQIGDRIMLGDPALASSAALETLRGALQTLVPWRKGPWSFYGLNIDTEWRSDWKWQRLTPHISPLTKRTVLDVGSGNGYYSWRMLASGAARVVAIDPTLVFLMQHLAVCHYLPDSWRDRLSFVPLRLEDLPEPGSQFDTLFSMGVLYHRREPLDHLQELLAWLRPGGELVLETLTVAGPEPLILDGRQRYARMRNVWTLPTPALLEDWLKQCGFAEARIVDQAQTTTAEQRTTNWMPFESLAQALDPDDPQRTIEGHPAPCRTLVVATRPAPCPDNDARVQGET